MAASSEYRVNIIISAKDQTSGATKKAVGSWTELKSALGLANAAFRQVYQAAEKAYKFIEKGASVQRAETSLKSLAATAGQSGTAIVKAIQTASDFTIDKMTAMQVANKAMLMGVAESPAQFEELARTATVLGRAMGLDAVTAIDRFVIAAGRKSVKVADDLGLLIDATAANEKYAESLGKTVDQLTASEQSQAFLNAMNEAAAPKVLALEGANEGLATGLDIVKAAISDTTSELAVMAAETFETTVDTHALAAAIRDIPVALDKAQEGYVEWSFSLGEAEAYLNGDTNAILRFQEAQKPVPRMLEEESDAFWGVYTSVEAVSKGVPTLTFETQKYLAELAEYETEGDNFVNTSTDISAVIRELAQRDLVKAREELRAYNAAIADFSLNAGMQWKTYFDSVDEQATAFEEDRERLSATHQENLEELTKRGQSHAISIDAAAEEAKLALLQERLAIALQRQSEFTDKTAESTRMQKTLQIQTLQGQVAEQAKLLDDYHAGRLRTTGENVNLLIAEENRRHTEAVAGLEEEITKTKELQRQQLGTLLMQTFETWAELKDIPPEKMLEMRTAIAKEYGLISDEEALLIGLSVSKWEGWAVSFKQSADGVVSDLDREIEGIRKLIEEIGKIPSEKQIDIIINRKEEYFPGGGGGGGPTFQGGGSFVVPPGYPNDTFPMRVSSGERVSVTPVGGDTNYTFNQTVNTQSTQSNVMRDWETAKRLVP